MTSYISFSTFPMCENVDNFSKSKFPDNENYCWKPSPRVLIVDLVFRHHGNDIFKPIQFFWTILRFNRIQKPFFQFFLGELLQNLTQPNSWKKNQGFYDSQFMVGIAACFFKSFNTFTPSIKQKFVAFQATEDS